MGYIKEITKMPTIEMTTGVIEGGYRGYNIAGAPVAGTNAVQTLTIGGTPTSGTFKVALDGNPTAAITWSATNATLLTNINAALDAVYGASQIVATAGTLTAGIGTILLTFSGTTLAKKVVSLMVVTDNSLVGTSPTAAITSTTAGVDATGRGAAKGAILIDSTNGILYQNTGTPPVSVWSKVGLET